MRRVPSLFEAVEVSVEVFAGVLPAEWFGGVVVALLEGQDRVGEVVEVGEVAGGDGFALQDREVDLDLVEPGRVDGQVDQDRVGPGLASCGRSRPAGVGGAVVDDPEHAFG